MKNSKLNVNKFRIAKLTGSQNVKGGAKDTSKTTAGLSADQPQCILTSQQYITAEG